MTQLMNHLATPQSDHGGWQLDRYALRNTALRYVLDHHKAMYWQVFYWCWQQKIWIFVRDECGSLIQFQQPLPLASLKSNDGSVTDQPRLVYLALKPLLQFLQNLLDQHHQCHLKQDYVRDLLLYRLQQDAQHRRFVGIPQRLPELDIELDEADLWGRMDTSQQQTGLMFGIGRTVFSNTQQQDAYDQLIRYWLDNHLPGDRLHIKRLRINDKYDLLNHLKHWQQIERRLRVGCMAAGLNTITASARSRVLKNR